jgi:hypothetical protein
MKIKNFAYFVVLFTATAFGMEETQYKIKVLYAMRHVVPELRASTYNSILEDQPVIATHLDGQGKTCFHYLADIKHFNLINKLLQDIPDLKSHSFLPIKDNNGESIFSLASRYANPSNFLFLLKHSCLKEIHDECNNFPKKKESSYCVKDLPLNCALFNVHHIVSAVQNSHILYKLIGNNKTSYDYLCANGAQRPFIIREILNEGLSEIKKSLIQQFFFISQWNNKFTDSNGYHMLPDELIDCLKIQCFKSFLNSPAPQTTELHVWQGAFSSIKQLDGYQHLSLNQILNFISLMKTKQKTVFNLRVLEQECAHLLKKTE